MTREETRALWGGKDAQALLACVQEKAKQIDTGYLSGSSNNCEFGPDALFDTVRGVTVLRAVAKRLTCVLLNYGTLLESGIKMPGIPPQRKTHFRGEVCALNAPPALSSSAGY